MAKQNVFLASVNAGEFSPKLESRIDFNKYPNGAKRLKNAIIYPQGGFYRRPGTKFTVNTKSDGQARLFPFIFDETDATVIEGGVNYFRFIRRQAQLSVADTDAAVTNGAFGSNITGWDDRSTGSGAIAHDASNGRMQLTGSAGDIAWAEQDITTTNTGQVHVLQFKVEGTIGLTCKFQVGTTSTGAELAFENGDTELELGIGWHSIAFTPSASPFYIQFKNDNNILDTAENIFIDDVALIDDAALEIASPYTAAEVQELNYEQAGDIVYLMHKDHEVHKLERRGTNTWSLVETFWNDGPWNEINENTDIDKKQLITNPQFFTGYHDWDNTIITAHSGATLEYDATNRQVVLNSNSTGHIASVEYNMATGFRSGTSTWYTAHFLITGSGTSDGVSRGTTLTVGTTSGATDILAATDYVAGWHTIDFQSTAANVFFEFSYQHTKAGSNGGVAALFVYPQDARLLDVNGQVGSITVTARGFSPFVSTDVGRYIRFEYPGKESGWGVITAVASSTSATLQVRKRIPVEKHTESWRFGAWSDTKGHPGTLSFYEGRTVAAEHDRRTMRFSQTLDLENMRPESFVEGGNSVEDDDALTFSLSSPQADEIQWITSLQKLVIGTVGGPWIGSSTGSVITPTDRSFIPQSATKASNIRPLLVGNAILYPSLSRQKLYELIFQFETDAFVTTDLTQLANHVSDVQMAHLAFQQEPDPVIWMIRDVTDIADGQLYALSYNRAEDIIGWSRMVLGGSWSGGVNSLPAVESIITIPGANDSGQTFLSGNREEVWMIVKRTVNSSTIRTIEFMEGRYEGPKREEYSTESAWIDAVQTDQKNAFYVDSGITYSGVSTTTITVGPHLEGESVVALADGKIQGPFTVTSGDITLTTAATFAHVGLAYTTEFESLKMPYGARGGTAIGKPKMITGYMLALLDSAKFSAGLSHYDDTEGRAVHTLESVDFTRTGSPLGSATTLSTWEYIISPEGAWSTDPRIWITTAEPLPFSLTGYGPNVDTSEAQVI